MKRFIVECVRSKHFFKLFDTEDPNDKVYGIFFSTLKGRDLLFNFEQGF